MTKSQEFIQKYKKVLETGGDFFNYDSCLQKPELAEGKKKFLLVLCSPAITKAVSATVSAIVDMFVEEMPDWYIDVAYLPTKKDIEVYDKCNMPYCLGQNLHLDASHYDMVGFSISVLHEVLTVPVIVKSFSRCDKPIPLTWTERKDAKVGEYPILMCGGITAAHGDIMFGELGDGRQAYLDFMCLGICDTTKKVCEQFLKETGTNQDFIDNCMQKWNFVYQPQSYKVEYKDNRIVKNIKINPKAQDFVTPYYPAQLPQRLGEGRTFTQANGANAGDTQVHWSESCTGFGVCAFCAEGSYCGRWQEESIEKIKKDCLRAKRHSAATSCKPLSYNVNHMSDFTECIYVMNSMYPKVTYLNMRLEELARDTEAFKMMKYTGASRLSAPIEGISRRIRQGFLNKNLSDEAIDKLFDFMIGQGISDLKVGCIYTGFEEKQDWDEVRHLIATAKAKAKALGKKMPARLKFTALVYYPGTGLELQERKTSLISYKGDRYFTDEIYEDNKEAGVSMKINGFRGSTFIEQAIVDLGGSLTEWLQNHIVAQGVVAYNMRPVATEENFPSFKALITNPKSYFSERDPDCYISPFHRIRLALEGTIATYWRRLQNQSIGDEPTGKCLYTYDGAKTVCAFGKIKKNPVIKYADCEIKDGVMTGTGRYELQGCTACPTPQERLSHQLKREWKHKFSVDDLQAQVVTRKQVKYRFVIKRLKEYSILNPHNTAFMAMAALLRQSDTLLENYWDMTDHSLYNQMDPELVSDISGIQVIDTVFRDDCLDEIKKSLAGANKELRTTQILGVYEIPMEEKMSVNDYNIYKFRIKGVSMEEFINSKASYKGGVRVLSNVDMQAKVTQQIDNTLVYPFFRRDGNSIVGTFALPRRYNPYLFFQEVLSEKKYTQKQLQQKVEFEVVTVVQKDSFTACKCGKPTVRSAVTGKSMGKCVDCITKMLLK